ncbi:MAG: hypothetical protein COB15_12370 [Flavobacteriales bacterium]|nr:MAG: hypothetical protein COB15_12370 [Flavobacteriales bacterium]
MDGGGEASDALWESWAPLGVALHHHTDRCLPCCMASQRERWATQQQQCETVQPELLFRQILQQQ